MHVYQTSYGIEKLKWPYEIKYGVVNPISVDVLVIGGGLGGGTAAIYAARAGAKVAVCDKAPMKRSGSGGAGIDHWLDCVDHPACRFTPEEYVEAFDKPGLRPLHVIYIGIKENYKVLLDFEKMGLEFRDVDGEFEGTPFRDPETKMLFAYDYKERVSVRLRGGDRLKPVIYQGMLAEKNITLYERVMITGLLTEGGKQGARVVGATGFSLETGEFYVFNAKAVILAAGNASGVWIFSTELCGSAGSSFNDPNCTGGGLVMAWKAGAEVTGMHMNGRMHGGGGYAWPAYGVGNCDNTWFPCNLVDANGKEVPWEDINGNPVTSVEARCYPADGQPYIASNFNLRKGINKPRIVRDFHERVRRGEFQLPLYADLPSMPPHERRAIWGLMVGNEGKTRFAVHEHYAEAGFNPDTDMLQVPIMDPESYGYGDFFGWYHGENNVNKNWRDCGSFGGACGYLMVDWDLMTSVEGLYAIGSFAGGGGASGTCGCGRYVGQVVARYVADRDFVPVDEDQVAAQKEYVYAPVKRVGDPDAYIGWKELWAGTTRVMQCCCRDYKTRTILEHGYKWLESIRESEMQQTYARNPHELARVIECMERLELSEMYIIGCINKIKAEEAGVKDDKFVVDRLENDRVVTTYRNNYYWLEAPNESTLLDNYRKRLRASD